MTTKGIIISALFIIPMFALSFWAMGQLPEGEKFATHWNAQGVADGFSDAGTVLWMLPAMALGISVLLAIVPFLDPRRSNLIRSSMAYLVAWIGTMVVLGFVHFMIVLNATGHINLSDVTSGPDVSKIMAIMIGIFLIALGAVFGKIRPNWFLGVRTPWTLSSDASWDKTHRLAGKLFLVTGLFTVTGVLVLAPELALMILVFGSLCSTLIAVVYSWWVWKNDPVRETLVPEEAD